MNFGESKIKTSFNPQNILSKVDVTMANKGVNLFCNNINTSKNHEQK